MSRFFSLIKYDFLNSYNVNNFIKGKNAVWKILLGAFLSVYFIVLSWIFNNGLMKDAAKIGQGDVALSMGLLTCTLAILGLGVIKLAGAIFGGKDFSMLTAMPLNKKSIIVAKVINITIPTFLMTGVFIIPSLVSYYLNAPNVDSLFLIRGIILIFFIPLVPTAIATLIGSLLLYVSSRFRYRNFITIGMFLVFILFMMFFPMLVGEEFITNIMQTSSKMTDVYSAIYPLNNFYIQSLINGNIMSMLIFMGISAGVFGVFVLIVDKVYLKINSRLLETNRKNNFKMTKQKETGVIHSLVINEIKKYFSMPMVLVNLVVGGILFIAYGFMAIFMGEKSIEMIFETAIDPSLKIGILVLVGTFCVLTSITTGNTISLEGNKFWQLKTLPIDVLDIFKSKLIVSMMIIVPTTLIGSILVGIGLKLNFLEIICAIIIILLVGTFGSMIGLVINLKFCNLNWTSEIAVVKRSASTMIMVFGGLGIVFLAAFLYMNIEMDIYVYLSIITGIIVIGNIIAYKLLTTFGVRRFKEL
ncbi:MAG: hypothetical protein ACRC28_10195 [Clostridium sp.]|uniref:hypothetical protein n=1 Tax=Clostridium sp. TaxID=1506 RepID=UPI003F35A07D